VTVPERHARMVTGVLTVLGNKRSGISNTEHGMHKCIVEEDFPSARIDEMERGLENTYCADDW
jgi:hypothetical protein